MSFNFKSGDEDLCKLGAGLLCPNGNLFVCTRRFLVFSQASIFLDVLTLHRRYCMVCALMGMGFG